MVIATPPPHGDTTGVWDTWLIGVLNTADSQIVTLSAAAAQQTTNNDNRYGKILNAHLIAWFVAEAFTWTTATYDGSNRMTAASVIWPDGSTGTYAATTLNATWLTVDAWTCTYVNAGLSITRTCTQPAVTRDGNGNITIRPTVSVV